MEVCRVGKLRQTIAVVVVTIVACTVWLSIKSKKAAPDRALRAAPPAQTTHDTLTSYASASTAIAGMVRTTRKVPIRGAHVCAMSAIAGQFNGVPSACADSREDGTYLLAGLLPGSFVVHAEASGFEPGVADDGRPVAVEQDERRADVDIALAEGGATLGGTVVDVTGGPVSRALVRVSSTSASPSGLVEVESDDTGHFEAHVTLGPVVVTAFAVGYAAGREMMATAPTKDLVLVLTPGSSVSGTVVSAADGQPVAGIRVRAFARNAMEATSPSVTSGDDGTFALEALKPGVYELAADGAHWSGGAQRPIEVGLLARLTGITVTVAAAQRVTGTVTFEKTGAPCRSGGVQLQRPGARTLVGKIDADGQVAIDGVKPAKYDVRVACSRGLLREGPQILEVGGDDVKDVAWKVSAGVGLAISVVDEAGEPVPWTEVRLEFPATGDGTSLQSFTVDGRGRYEYPPVLEPGNYRLLAGGAYESQPVVLDLREGAGVTEATLRLDGSGAITVAVRSNGGDAVDGLTVVAKAIAPNVSAGPMPSAASPAPSGAAFGADVMARFESTQRAASGFAATALGNGQYRIAPLKAGEYRVEVDDGTGRSNATDATQVVSVRSSTVTAEFVLDRDGKIGGRVIDGRGEPVADVWVSVARDVDDIPGSSEMASPVGAPVLTGADGVFEIGRLARGSRYSVRVQQPDTAGAVQRDVAVGDKVTLTLVGLGSLSGTAVDDEGRPVTHFSLGLQQGNVPHGGALPVTTQGGTWTAERVPAGHVRITAIDDQSRVGTQEVDVVEGKRVDGVRLLFSGAALAATHP
jgi:hypothetical protein